MRAVPPQLINAVGESVDRFCSGELRNSCRYRVDSSTGDGENDVLGFAGLEQQALAPSTVAWLDKYFVVGVLSHDYTVPSVATEDPVFLVDFASMKRSLARANSRSYSSKMAVRP